MQSGSDKAAIAWAIAKNIEQSNGLENQKKAYRDGIDDGKNPHDKITEEWEKDIPDQNPNLLIPVDDNGNTNGGEFIGNMEDGLRFQCGENTYDGVTDEYYVDIKVDYSQYGIATGSLYEGLLKWSLYGKKTGLVEEIYTNNRSNWWVRTSNENGGAPYRYVVEWIVNPKNRYLHSTHLSTIDGRYYDNDWVSTTTKFLKILNVWQNAKTVSTII